MVRLNRNEASNPIPSMRLKNRERQNHSSQLNIPTTIDWRPYYSEKDQAFFDSIAKDVLSRLAADPSIRILATTHTLLPQTFGRWDPTRDPYQPAGRRYYAFARLWEGFGQFNSRLGRAHCNHYERKPDERPFALAFIDDPSAKFGDRPDVIRLPHIHATVLIRGAFAAEFFDRDQLRHEMGRLWSKCPSADHFHIQHIGSDREAIAGWLAYSAKYVWLLKRLGQDDSQAWKLFG